MDAPHNIPTLDDMLAAHERIKPYIRRTPIRTSDYLNELTGAQLFFKCENFQEPGAFKVQNVRGILTSGWIPVAVRVRCVRSS